MSFKKSYNQDQAIPSLKIRFSKAADIDPILQYYKENQHEHVHVRERDWYADHARKGQYMLGFNGNDEIIASSGTYDYRVGNDTKDEPSYHEMGSTNFKRGEGTGFNLYPFFIASQVIQALLAYPPKDMCIANVYDDSPVGKKMLVPVVGWQEIQPTQDILGKFKSSKSAEHKNNNPMTWYGTPTPTLPHMARIVLSFILAGEVSRPVFEKDPQTGAFLKDEKTGKKVQAIDLKTGEPAVEKLKLDLNKFSLANEFRAAVETIAHGPFADYLEQNPHIGMKQARAELESYMIQQQQPKPGHPNPR
ncbi:MAG: hypothetical protein H6867_04340 [Rhodospirillales bacterium]|nr:hypothetical protein [Rhodospirillales bacterium]MCB9996379.1 hypothetical protein [Rhodospirillales bacterium]